MRSLVSISLAVFLATNSLAQTSTNLVLTNAAAILALPGDSAWGHNVRIRGVVTAAQPSTTVQPNWDGKFFVQDDTAGIFAEDSAHRRPEPGDYVEVTGVSHPGGFAPFISYAQWTKLGTAPLPPAKSVPIEQLMAGVEDSQRVEITGIVRAFIEEKPVVLYEITSGGYRLKVYAPPLPGVEPESLIGANVRVRGTASTFFSGVLRQLITVELHVPFAADFVVEKKPPSDPFAAPILPLNRLGQYHRDRKLGERVHVKGMVTFQRPGEDVFIQDATSGLQIKSRQNASLNPGEIIEAVGFLEFDRFLPVLQDATFRKTSEPTEKLEPKATPVWELKAGYRHADLIRLEGRVLDHMERPGADAAGLAGQSRTILALQSADTVFTVEGFSADALQALAAVPIGSTVEVDGICFMNIAEDGKLQTLQIFLPAANAIRILEKPDWLTPQRLLIGLGASFAVLCVAATWIVMVQRRNLALKVSVAEKTKAQQELQQANEQLESRVAERTKQLKVEMTARKEAELQFKATLSERTRLAQELHDTLEQSLTGIGLQVDAAAKLGEQDQAVGRRHLGLARSLMTQTQLELRRSIWDLRSRELEQFDFPNALRVSAQQIADSAKLKLELSTTGTPRALSEVTEENLLRISQAALNNVIKHAQASRVIITLDFGAEELTLRIADNGQGFNPEQTATQDGHFGLVGIAERAKRLNGQFHLTSEPQRGTTVEVRIPLRPPNTRETGPSVSIPEFT